mmetsp:Transcript_61141/g.145679  ORF Transcript_61141/g.145679 Transcript_61141/m.145679 type:complete len:264 (-) Transcript_61141:851-1642(-)
MRYAQVLPKHLLGLALHRRQAAVAAAHQNAPGSLGRLHGRALGGLGGEDHKGAGGALHLQEHLLGCIVARGVVGVRQVDVPRIQHLPSDLVPKAVALTGRAGIMPCLHWLGKKLQLLFQRGRHLALLVLEVPGHGHTHDLTARSAAHLLLESLLSLLAAVEAWEVVQPSHVVLHGVAARVHTGRHFGRHVRVHCGAHDGKQVGEDQPSHLGPQQVQLPLPSPAHHRAQDLRGLGLAVAQDQQILADKVAEAQPHRQQRDGPDQ